MYKLATLGEAISRAGYSVFKFIICWTNLVINDSYSISTHDMSINVEDGEHIAARITNDYTEANCGRKSIINWSNLIDLLSSYWAL